MFKMTFGEIIVKRPAEESAKFRAAHRKATFGNNHDVADATFLKCRLKLRDFLYGPLQYSKCLFKHRAFS